MLGGRLRVSGSVLGEVLLSAAGDPDDERTIARVQNTVRRKMRAAKLEGLEFAPDRALLRVPAIRRLRTTEGVLLFYPDRVAQTDIDGRRTDNGGEVITITTRRIEEDGVVRSEPRSAA